MIFGALRARFGDVQGSFEKAATRAAEKASFGMMDEEQTRRSLKELKAFVSAGVADVGAAFEFQGRKYGNALALLVQVSHDALPLMELLVEAGACVNARDEEACVLAHAIAQKCLPWVRTLVRKGADMFDMSGRREVDLLELFVDEGMQRRLDSCRPWPGRWPNPVGHCEQEGFAETFRLMLDRWTLSERTVASGVRIMGALAGAEDGTLLNSFVERLTIEDVRALESGVYDVHDHPLTVAFGKDKLESCVVLLDAGFSLESEFGRTTAFGNYLGPVKLGDFLERHAILCDDSECDIRSLRAYVLSRSERSEIYEGTAAPAMEADPLRL